MKNIPVRTFCVIFCTIFLFLEIKCDIFLQNDSLVLVHAIFRHGQRTNDLSVRKFAFTKNATYAPFGWGQLTNRGKQTEYELGQFLRRRYGQFLGKYHPAIYKARSTGKDRSKLSLQLVLASLFPPEDDLIWNESLNWQPAVYDTPKSPNDILLYAMVCESFLKLLDEYVDTPDVRKEMLPFNESIAIINANTEFKLDPIGFPIMTVQSCLLIEDEQGLKLPDWTNKVYPEKITDLVRKYFEIAVRTTEMKRTLLGTLLKKIVRDTTGKINNELNYGDKKIYLYSGHDLTIGPLLSYLGHDNQKLPVYGACIMIELHKIENEYGFKIYYRNDQTDSPKLLKLPNCEDFCSLEKFVELHEEFFANENTVCLGSSDEILDSKTKKIESNSEQIKIIIGIVAAIIILDVLFLFYIYKKYLNYKKNNKH